MLANNSRERCEQRVTSAFSVYTQNSFTGDGCQPISGSAFSRLSQSQNKILRYETKVSGCFIRYRGFTWLSSTDPGKINNLILNMYLNLKVDSWMMILACIVRGMLNQKCSFYKPDSSYQTFIYYLWYYCYLFVAILYLSMDLSPSVTYLLLETF